MKNTLFFAIVFSLPFWVVAIGLWTGGINVNVNSEQIEYIKIKKQTKSEKSPYPAEGIYSWYWDGRESFTGNYFHNMPLSLIRDYCQKGHGTTTVAKADIGVTMSTVCQK